MGRTPSPVPFCIIGKVSWGVVQAIKVPEDRAHLYTGKHGWSVLIRDSELGPPPVDLFVPSQSNPRRVADKEDGS